ncbi:hypothetical protein HDV00_010883 [Rhizophlyctis rosea]|nr:hypothetical protein HDV00_010883 [Rhizophlyctis rosea]
MHRIVTEEKYPLPEMDAHEARFADLCCAAHGLSLLITARINGEERTILFDAGPDPAIFSRNAGRLGVPFEKIDGIILSHWHSDHSGGLVEAIRSCHEATGRKVDVDVHPDYPERRGIELKGKYVAWQKDPTFEQLERAGGEVHKNDAAHVVYDDSFYISGEIPRVTEYETGLPQVRWRSESKTWEPDPLIMDERFVCVHVKGLVNVCKHAHNMFPDTPLYAVVGGFHLAGHNESRIEPTVKDLLDEDIRPQVFMPGHCTGWRARGALEAAFPNCVVPIGAGNTAIIGNPQQAFQ